MTPYYETEYGTLYHGDCQDVLDALDVSFSALLLDGMYGIGATTHNKTAGRGGKVLKGTRLECKDWKIMPDNTPFDPAPWLRLELPTILWGGNHFTDKLPASKKWIIWDKRCKNSNRDDNADCEIAWTNLKGVSRVYHHLWKGVCREGEENLSRSGAKLHPFQKPVALFAFCLREFKLNPGDVVLDPYSGSGTTAVVCERMGLKWVCIEIEKHFCDVTVNRLEQEHVQTCLFAA